MDGRNEQKMSLNIKNGNREDIKGAQKRNKLGRGGGGAGEIRNKR